MSTAMVTTRFAPSPTGRLHLGNARTALFNWLLAKQAGGCFVLRLEDTDAARSTAEFAADCLADLRWLGLEWDAGPDGLLAVQSGERTGGQSSELGPYRQSERTAIYAGLVARLREAGHVYECYCSQVELAVSRKRQLEAGRPPRYLGTCRHLSAEQRAAQVVAGRQPTLRFRVPEGGSVAFTDLVRGPQLSAATEIGDFVIARSDGSAVFFFANAVDDALMGITHVLRGEDHLTNTFRQLLVLQALSLPAPQYGHLSLLGTATGGPLSKREGATSLADLREQGYLPAALRNFMARLGHSYTEPGWMDDAALSAGFNTDHLGRAPAQVDEAQLRHWQHEAVQRAGLDELRPWFAGLVPAAAEEAFLKLIRGNITLPAEARHWAQVVFGGGEEVGSKLPPTLPGATTQEPAASTQGAAIASCGSELARDCFPDAAAHAAFFAALAAAYEEHGANVKALGAAVLAATGAKGKGFFLPLRLALTGGHAGPELQPLLALLPPAIVRARLLVQNAGLAG
jgi:glutamyl-tRNA synthetase